MNKNQQNEVRENVVAGIVGAFLFSLVGGVLWYVIYQIGFIAGISGLVGAVCAIKGYTIFAKKESMKGIIIAVVMSLLVMAIAWYVCLAQDVYNAYQSWLAAGEVDYAPTFFESMRYAHEFLSEPEIGSAYIKDLVMGLVFCVIGGGSYVVNKMKAAKQAASPVATPVAAPVEETPAEEPKNEEPQA